MIADDKASAIAAMSEGKAENRKEPSNKDSDATESRGPKDPKFHCGVAVSVYQNSGDPHERHSMRARLNLANTLHRGLAG